MRLTAALDRLVQWEPLNFVLTNHVPRRQFTRLAARFTRIEQPLVRDLSLWLWQIFGGAIDLSEAKKQRFDSVHDCFIRELRDGARPVDASPVVVTSPCDAIVGACGRIVDGLLIQAKGITYALDDLLIDEKLAAECHDGTFATLRLTSTMYHRFHAPDHASIRQVLYFPGDTWNVNPPTLKRKRGVFCLNERAVIELRPQAHDELLVLVPVAAILVAGLHLKFMDLSFTLDSPGPRRLPCDVTVAKGEELGHFFHGSTIVVLGSAGLTLAPGVAAGNAIRVGEALFERMRPTSR